MYRLHTSTDKKASFWFSFIRFCTFLLCNACNFCLQHRGYTETLVAPHLHSSHPHWHRLHRPASAKQHHKQTSKNQWSQRKSLLFFLFFRLNFFAISASGLAVHRAAPRTESSRLIRERCFITTGQVDIFPCFPCLLSVELTQEDCDLAWWYLRPTPFWYRLGCLKPGLSGILHICCCLLHRAMDSFDGTRGIKGGNQWVQWVSKGANFSFISEQSIASIKLLLAGMES